MLSKTDLKNIGSLIDQRLDEKLKPVNRKLNGISKDLNMYIKQSQLDLKHHHDRLVKIEKKTGVTRPPYPIAH